VWEVVSLFRARVVGLTRLVLLALAVSVVPHLDAAVHDTDGEYFAVVHDHATHRIHDASSPAPDGPTHCAICHVGRSVLATPSSQGVPASPSAGVAAGFGYESIVPRRVAFSLPPLRSPPAPIVLS
jgi:hypothetical protein